MARNTILTDNFNPYFNFTLQNTKPRHTALAAVCK